jgi:hypothetical protein
MSVTQLFFLRRAQAPPTPWTHLWSVRRLWGVSDLADWEHFQASVLRIYIDAKPQNSVVKVLTRPAEPTLCPIIIGEREIHLWFHDPSSPRPQWVLRFRGPQYAALFARWFDELWALPNAHTLYGPNGLNEQEIERVRQKLEGLKTSSSQA